MRRAALGFARVVVVVALIVSVAVAIAPAREFIARTLGTAEDLAVASGFGLDTVTVSGQRFTTDTDVYDCLRLPANRTMFSLDSRAAKACIEALPWVDKAGLTRVYPGRLDAAVVERQPFAVWQRPGVSEAVLVDRTGRVLGSARAHRETLLRIAGDKAPDAAVALTEALAHVPAIAARLDRAVRIDGRRWSLVLQGNITIELPAEGEATALGELLRHPRGTALLSTGDRVIDLRSRFEIAVRPASATRGG